MNNNNSYTVTRKIEETISLATGKSIRTLILDEPTSLKSIVRSFDVVFDDKGYSPIYAKVARLIKKGLPLYQALSTAMLEEKGTIDNG